MTIIIKFIQSNVILSPQKITEIYRFPTLIVPVLNEDAIYTMPNNKTGDDYDIYVNAEYDSSTGLYIINPTDTVSKVQLYDPSNTVRCNVNY